MLGHAACAESWRELAAAVCVSDLQQQEAEAAHAQQQQQQQPAAAPEQATGGDSADDAQPALLSRMFSSTEGGACASPAMSGLTARLRTSAAFHQRLLALLGHKGADAPGAGLALLTRLACTPGPFLHAPLASPQPSCQTRHTLRATSGNFNVDRPVRMHVTVRVPCLVQAPSGLHSVRASAAEACTACCSACTPTLLPRWRSLVRQQRPLPKRGCTA